MNHNYVDLEIKQFREWMELYDKSPGTITRYTEIVYRFLTDWKEDILEFKRATRHIADATGNTYKAAIKSYLIFRGVDFDPNILKSVRVRDQKRNLIDREIISGLVAKSRPHHNSKDLMAWRNHSIVSLIGYTGIRRQECCNILVKDVEIIENERIYIKGIKREPSRYVYPPPKTAYSINKYQTLANLSQKDSLFGLKGITVWEILKKLTGYPPKDFRTSFGTEVYRKTLDIELLQSLMGHVGVGSCKPYIQLAKSYPEKIKEVRLYE